MNGSSSAKPSLRTACFVAICAGLLLLFGFISYRAILTKSATFDEPLHLIGGFIHRTTGDFRVNPEDPALFGDWAALPFRSSEISVNYQSPYWAGILSGKTEWSNDPQGQLVMQTLYRTPQNDGDALIQKSRFMFIIVGVLLGGVIAWWSWQFAGMWAAIAATVLYAFDPNFLANSALVKNDVMLTLVMTTLIIAVWRFGQRGTWPALIGIAVACAVAVNVKFSGLFCGPLILVMLIVRAMLPASWYALGLTLHQRWQRVVAAFAVCIFVGVVSYLAIWASYGFRFVPTADAGALLDSRQQVQNIKTVRFIAAHDRQPVSLTEIDQEPAGAVADVIVWAQSVHLLPQAWLHGLLFTYATTLNRFSFLLGDIRATGWWYYFPCAVLFKTPTATLLAALLTMIAGGVLLKRGRKRGGGDFSSQPKTIDQARSFDRWSAACLCLPAVLYLANAMSTNMNVGLRHLLPVYPFAFVAIGVVFAALINGLRGAGRIVVGIIAGSLAAGLMAESLAAYPHFLAFFNTPSGGRLGGIKLLSDCNLDWGQDLKLLAQWQQTHSDKKLYLNYFGSTDPDFYRIAATRMPGGWLLDESVSELPYADERCYIAISATNLQGIYYHPSLRAMYRQLMECEPKEVLGGSIYIYEAPLTPRANQQRK